VDAFAVSQLVGKDHAAEVARRIDRQAYAAVVIQNEPLRWSMGVDVDRALAARYRVDHVSQWGAFLLPRSGD
jgi:hypothetical protein